MDERKIEREHYARDRQQKIALHRELLRELTDKIEEATAEYDRKLKQVVPDWCDRYMFNILLKAFLVKAADAVDERHDDDRIRMFRRIEETIFRDFTPEAFLEKRGIKSRHDFDEIAEDVYAALVTGENVRDPEFGIGNIFLFLEDKLGYQIHLPRRTKAC